MLRSLLAHADDDQQTDALASNGGRAWFNRTEIHRRLVGVFSLGAVPGAAAGTLLLAATPTEDTLARIIGGCLLALVLWRR